MNSIQESTTANSESLPVLDAEGYAVCPDCDSRINCGTIGLANLEKRHRGKKVCKTAREKRDKEAKKRKDGTILSFLKPKPTIVPSTISSPTPVHSYKFVPQSATDTTPTISTAPQQGNIVSSKLRPVSRPISNFINTLQDLVKGLPESVPEASEFDRLAVFGGTPQEFDDSSLDADELWEMTLNQVLKSALGWGREGNMDEIIRRGRWGLDGLVRFATYFVEERGVSEGLFEGKLTNLVTALKERVLANHTHSTRPTIAEIPDAPTAVRVIERSSSTLDIITSAKALASLDVPMLRECTSQPDKAAIIDVDAFEYEDILKQPKTSVAVCEGYTMIFPDGKSPHTAYPFALHDTIILPWDYALKNGVMKLFARSCRGLSDGSGTACQPCRQLIKNETLENILTRMGDGVHENAGFAYHGFSGLQEMLHRKNQLIEFYRLRGLNQARKLLAKATALSDQKRLLMAVASGKASRVDRLISIGLRQKKGARGLLASYMAAAEGYYNPKSFTEEEDMKALLLWKLGGNRVAEINHRANNAPSISYLRTRSTVPPIIPSHEQPTVVQVKANIEATFDGVLEVIHGQNRSQFIHTVLMFDELATEKRIRWDPKTNYFLGLCREHAHNTATEFTNEDDMEELFQRLDDGKVHHAGEATVGALGILCKDNRIYPGRPVLVSGDCKRESGEEHAAVIKTVLTGVNALQDKTKLRIVSIASDGETRRGSAFILLTFKSRLLQNSPIYPILEPLNFLNLHVGDDDLTCDKDWKHIFKRWRNLLLRQRGVVVNSIRITPDIIKDQFRSAGLSVEHIRSLFNPDDQQDVKMAFDMLKDIWSLPRSSTNSRRGFLEAREALWILGKLLYHMVFPYLCVDLSLSEQVEHLSAAAHLAMILYRLAGKEFVPTNLYIDFMIMVKNVLFCAAKAKIDNPDGEFWLILLGTDRLEELFGILRTMVGNDANLDILQLVSRLSGTTEVANILAKYPQWDRSPRRLKLPAMSRESKEIPDSADHIKPASWRGNVKLKDVSLQTSWNRGRRITEQECEGLKHVLDKLDNLDGIDILSPFGTLLFDVPLADDDIDESLEAPPTTSANEITNSSDHEIDMRMDVEDELGAELASSNTETSADRRVFDSKVLIKGIEKSKARALKNFSKYRQHASSTDRLKRVQDIPRFVNTEKTLDCSPNHSLEHHVDDTEKIVVSDPISTLVCVENQFWLCLGEVNGLRVDGRPVDDISFEMLPEETVTVSYQMLGLRPATLADDLDGRHDWRTYTMGEQSFTVPGRLIQSVNPTMSKTHLGIPFYLLQSTVLVALTASLFQSLTISDLKTVPKLAPTKEYPYRQGSGEACFVCESDQNLGDIGSMTTSDCPRCSPAVSLDLSQGQRVLEHIGSHILYDPAVIQSIEPLCGLCLRPSQMCQFYLAKGKGANGNLRINQKTSKGCLIKMKYSYGIAAESTASSPCSNVPIYCPICPKTDPAIWKYFMKIHFEEKHKTLDLTKYECLWKLSNFERSEMKKIWVKRGKVTTRRTKKSKIPPLVISENHRARIPTIDDGETCLSRSPSPEADEVAEPGEIDTDGGDFDEEELAETSETGDFEGCSEDLDVVVSVGREEFGEDCEVPGMWDNTQNPGDFGVEPVPIMQEPSTNDSNNKTTESSGGNEDGGNSSSGVGATLSDVVATEENPEESGWSKRKRVPRRLADALNGCLCGLVLNSSLSGVLKCKQAGCETQWYHLHCVGLEQEPRNWVCEACEASGRGRGGKRQRK